MTNALFTSCPVYSLHKIDLFLLFCLLTQILGHEVIIMPAKSENDIAIFIWVRSHVQIDYKDIAKCVISNEKSDWEMFWESQMHKGPQLTRWTYMSPVWIPIHGSVNKIQSRPECSRDGFHKCWQESSTVGWRWMSRSEQKCVLFCNTHHQEG